MKNKLFQISAFLALSLSVLLAQNTKATRNVTFVATGATPKFGQLVNGQTASIADPVGGQSQSWEFSISGTAPTTVSIPITGCMPGGTCSSTLVTFTSTSSGLTTTAGLYDHFNVPVSWTGGDATTQVTVSTVLGLSKSGGSGGLTITNVAGLATVPGKTNGTIAVVTNGSSATDCTVGGGATVVNCQFNGSTWAQLVGSSSGGTAFSAITGSTNGSASMVCGTGCAISTSGSGTNVATNSAALNGNTFAAPGAIGGGTPGAGTFTALTANTSLTVNGGTAQTGTQGTDTKLLTAGTISGTTAPLCTDANGGATTVSCPNGSGTFAGLNTTGANGTNTNATPWSIAPGSVIGGSSPLFSLVSATNETDTAPLLFINAPGSSETVRPVEFQIQSVDQFQLCPQPGQQGETVFGSAVTCANIYTTTFAKNVFQTQTAAHTLIREWQGSNAATGDLNQWNSATTAGTGFNFLTVYAGVTGTDTFHTGGTQVFKLDGSGQVTAANIIDTAITSSTSPICPNGTGGAFTITGCVQGSSNVNNATQFSSAYYSAGGSSNVISGAAPGTNQGTYVVGRPNTTQGTAVAQQDIQVGDCTGGGSTVSGATTTYTVLYTDVLGCTITHDRAASAAVTVTIPTPTTLNNAAPIFVWENDSASTDVLTPTTFTISLGNAAAAATLNVPSNTSCLGKLDPFNASTWKANCHPISTTGGGAVSSVNTLTGAVVIEAATAGQVAISGGNNAALTGAADMTYSTHTFATTTNGIFDWSAATGSNSLKFPPVVGGTFLAGTVTANLSAPIVIQNTNSTNNNTSITAIFNSPGTSTGQTTVNINCATTQGNCLESGTGGAVTSGVLSGQTKTFQVAPTGFVTLGAATGCGTAQTSGGICPNEGTAPTGTANVDTVHADSTQHALEVNNNNTGFMPVSRTACVNITPVTVAASVTTDQTLMACSFNANLLNVVGRTIKVYTAGVFSTAAASTASLTFKAKLCTVSGCGSGTVISPITTTTGATAALSATNLSWSQTSYISTQTAGASSAYEAHGFMTIDLSATAATPDSVYQDTNTATVGTIDSTGALFLQITCAASAASTSNSFTDRILVVEVVN